MSLNSSCLNKYEYEDISLISLNESKSVNLTDSLYNPNGNSLISKLSSLIRHSLISANEFELFIKNPIKFKTKFLSLILIISTINLLLFIIFSTIFYKISYSSFRKFKITKSNLNLKKLNIIFFVIIILLIVIEMIFLIEHLNQTKIYLNKSIEQINEEFYLKTISKHLKYLLNQFNSHSNKSNLIIVDGSKSLIIKSFNEYYYIDQIDLFLQNLNKDFNQINEFISKDENLKSIFYKFLNSYKDFLDLNNQICDLIDKNHNEIQEKVRHSLNEIQSKINFLINFSNEFISKNINSTLFDSTQQEYIHSSISLITNFVIMIISIITLVPFVFLILITFKYFSLRSKEKTKRQIRHDQLKKLNKNRFHYLDVNQLEFSRSHNSQRYTIQTLRPDHKISTRKHQSRRINNSNRNEYNPRSHSSSKKKSIRQKSKNLNKPYLCSIRISYGFILILIIILCVLNSLSYVIDLFVQSCCQLVHYDQPYLISLLSDNLIKSKDELNLNKIVNNLINDCNNKIHFSKKFFEEYSNELNDQMILILKNLNENIYRKFFLSIQIVNITSDLHLLKNLMNFNSIENDFYQIEQIFKQITSNNYQLSIQFLTKTLNKFELFLNKILESTIDSCPLPMEKILQIDQLICHQTANLINGLWLRIFFFMFVIVFGICIFGLCIYKRLY